MNGSPEQITAFGVLLTPMLGAVTAILVAVIRNDDEPPTPPPPAVQGAGEPNVAEMVAAILHQVKNDHSSNLRDDFDALRDEMRRGFKSVHTRVDNVVERLDRHIDHR